MTSAWNEDISQRPVLTNSDAMIAQIISDLATANRTLRVFEEMNFVLVPDAQPLVPIDFLVYPEDSDPGPWPIPPNMPIETWPDANTNTLSNWQHDTYNQGGDRHSIVVQPGAGFTFETWQAKLNGTNWEASNGAKFDLKSNTLRPAGYTSGDAAGLSMFPALVRYEECQRGMVEHACRIVVKKTRKEYIYPATHWASSTPATQTNVPAMGQRVRLKSNFVIPASWAKEEKALLLGLKKYGAMVADNGNFFSISITPDDRWAANAFNHISSIGITNFEVIQTTGASQGPRSAGAPGANAGADQTVTLGSPINLQGFVSFSGSEPAIQWKLYSGPGNATLGNSAVTNTSVTVTNSGVYTFILSATDGIHAVAYDAVVVAVTRSLTISLARAGTNISLSWTGAAAPYVVEQTDVLRPTASWNTVLTTNGNTVLLPISAATRFFRVKGQ